MKRKHIQRTARAVLLVYLAFAVLGGLVPYAFPPAVDEDNALALQNNPFTADTTGPDRALVVEDPTNALDVRIQLLREATETLDIVYHTMQYGESAQAFFGEVVLAADRGVNVRLLVDGKAGALTPSALALLKTTGSHENIELRKYAPLNLFKPWQWNSLLHDKFIIADGEYLLLGGRNIGDAYYAPESYNGAVTNDRDVFVWREGTAEDSVLPQAQDYMQLLWDSEHTKAPASYSDKKAAQRLEALREAARHFEAENPVYYIQTLAGYRDASVETNRITLVHNPINASVKQPLVGYALRELLLSAEQSALVQTPYATANKHFLSALDASAGKVPTTLLTNSVVSSPNYPAYSNYNANRAKFFATGTALYELQSTDSIHGKSMLVDGCLAAVGSFNMDDRSLTIDTETMLIIHSEAFAAQLYEAMDEYIYASLQADAEGGYLPGNVEPLAPSWGKSLGMWLFSFISRPFQFLI